MSILDYWKEVDKDAEMKTPFDALAGPLVHTTDADGVTHYETPSRGEYTYSTNDMPAVRFSQGMPAGYEVVYSEDWEAYFGVRNRGSKVEYIDGIYACRWSARSWCVADAKRLQAREGNPLHINVGEHARECGSYWPMAGRKTDPPITHDMLEAAGKFLDKYINWVGRKS